jgi:hypothetical protein
MAMDNESQDGILRTVGFAQEEHRTRSMDRLV